MYSLMALSPESTPISPSTPSDGQPASPPDSSSSPPPTSTPPPTESPPAPPPSTPDAHAPPPPHPRAPPPPTTKATPPPKAPEPDDPPTLPPPPPQPKPKPSPSSPESPSTKSLPSTPPAPPGSGGVGGLAPPSVPIASTPPVTLSSPSLVLSPPGVPNPPLPPAVPSLSPPSTFASLPPPGSNPSVSNATSITPSNRGSLDDGSLNEIKYGVAIGVTAALIVVGIMMGIFYLHRKRRRKQQYSPYIVPSPFHSSQGSGSAILMQQYKAGGNDSMGASPDVGLGNSKICFSFEELSKVTSGFSSQNIVGAGGFGCVYKGHLEEGRIVAVKKLKAGSGQGEREFKAEVEIISRVHHRHLVSLVGYCINDLQRLLVYEFVPNNSLHHHLHGSVPSVMEWSLRVKVAVGSAKGLAYLHEDCHPRIIHRDIKSANILLDNNFEAQVADFGLAKLAEELDAKTHVSTRVMGTFGYMAPEYASSGKLTDKSDVFSFGVVLLELITGRKPVDESQPLGDESLVEWARPLLTQALDTENFDALADHRLEGNYDQGEMFRMVEAAAACVRHSASKRPKMSQVARALSLLHDVSTDLSNGIKPGESEIIDSREQSAQIRMFQRMGFGTQEMSPDDGSQSSWSSGGLENINHSQGGWNSGGR